MILSAPEKFIKRTVPLDNCQIEIKKNGDTVVAGIGLLQSSILKKVMAGKRVRLV